MDYIRVRSCDGLRGDEVIITDGKAVYAGRLGQPLTTVVTREKAMLESQSLKIEGLHKEDKCLLKVCLSRRRIG